MQIRTEAMQRITFTFSNKCGEEEWLFGWENAWTWHAFHSYEFEEGLEANETF